MKKAYLKAEITANGIKREITLKQIPLSLTNWGFPLDIDATSAANELAYKNIPDSELLAPDFNVFIFVDEV